MAPKDRPGPVAASTENFGELFVILIGGSERVSKVDEQGTNAIFGNLDEDGPKTLPALLQKHATIFSKSSTLVCLDATPQTDSVRQFDRVLQKHGFDHAWVIASGTEEIAWLIQDSDLDTKSVKTNLTDSFPLDSTARVCPHQTHEVALKGNAALNKSILILGSASSRAVSGGSPVSSSTKRAVFDLLRAPGHVSAGTQVIVIHIMGNESTFLMPSGAARAMVELARLNAHGKSIFVYGSNAFEFEGVSNIRPEVLSDIMRSWRLWNETLLKTSKL